MAAKIGRRRVVLGGLAGALLAACGGSAPTPPVPAAAPAAKPTEAAQGAPEPTRPATAASSGPTAGAVPAATKPSAPPAASAATPAAGAAAAPPKRGGGGTLKLLYWQGPTILNRHLAVGVKDNHAARLCTEPLITMDPDGRWIPVLAAEVPSQRNGGLAEDGKSVTYKLKKDVKWADGSPFTADDVVFTWQFVIDPATAATTISQFAAVSKVEAIDPLTVKISFKDPNPAWFVPFSNSGGAILPKAAFKDYQGAKAKDAPFNLKAYGTGPYMVDDFKPGDLVVYKINPNYREPNKPFFDVVQIKGGGDAPSAARAVFQTGEYDYAWNLQVEWPVLEEIMKGGKGDLVTLDGGGVEQLYLNFTDPNKEVDGERSSLKAPHPFLTDKVVRQAMALAIDKDTLAKQLYGQTGDATPNVLTVPKDYRSPNTKYEFNIQKANQMLDDAGYKKGADGIRVTKDGVRMKVTYATSINTLRQKEQALVKDGWNKIGIDVELRAIDQSVYFASTPGNNDTLAHFYWDVMMHTSTFGSPWPSGYMKRWYSGDPARDVAQKANNWSGNNYNRWINADYNKLWEQVQSELDPEKAKAAFVKMNDMVIGEFVNIPLVDRRTVSAKSKALKGPVLVAFDDDPWNIQDWTK